MDAFVRHVAEQPASELGAFSPFAKVFCSEEAFAVCDQAVQLHGALGFIEADRRRAHAARLPAVRESRGGERRPARAARRRQGRGRRDVRAG